MRFRTRIFLLVVSFFLTLSNSFSKISVYAEEVDSSQKEGSVQLGSPVECASNHDLCNNWPQSGTVLWRYQDELYFFNQEEPMFFFNKPKAGIIYKIHEGQVVEVHSLRLYCTKPSRPKPEIVYTLDNFIYFYTENANGQNNLVCYNLDTDTETVLVENYYDRVFLRYHHLYVSPDKTIHYPVLNSDTKEWEVLLIQEDQVLGIQEEENHYIELGHFKYFTVGRPNDPYLPLFETDWLIQRSDTDGEEKEDFVVNGQSINVQCEGLYKAKAGLIVRSSSLIDDCHTDWGLLLSQDEIVPLFPLWELDPTLFYFYEESFAVLEDRIYVSRKWIDRYNLPPEQKEMNHKDEIEGTYCINLLDLSVSKITDQTFDRMFVIDDQGIFCTRGITIYKLDWEGNIQRVLS